MLLHEKAKSVADQVTALVEPLAVEIDQTGRKIPDSRLAIGTMSQAANLETCVKTLSDVVGNLQQIEMQMKAEEAKVGG